MGIQNIQSIAEENQTNSNSSEELIEREQLEGTPFEVIGNHTQGYFISIGKFRITEIKKTRKELIEHLEKEKWTIICNMIATMIAIDAELKKQDENLKQ